MLVLFITYFLSVVSKTGNLYSATIRGNKLIGIYTTDGSNNATVRVFELKESSISGIFNNGEAFNLGFYDMRQDLKIFDTSDSLQEGNSKLWVKSALKDMFLGNRKPQDMNWVGYIDLDDMSLKNGTSVIEFPTSENFPVSGYTINKITNEFGSTLYITGGFVFSKKDSSYSIENSFYKYNLTSKEWVDMTYSANGKLKPLSDHKSVIIDNRYLVILGGKRRIIYNSTSNAIDNNLPIYEYNSIYNLTIFDTLTNIWENISIEPDMFYSSLANIRFQNFLATVYNGKIIVLGGFIGEQASNTGYTNTHLGILDFKSKNWNWNPIFNEDGSKYSSFRNHKDFVIFNDQLIIFSDYAIGDKEVPFNVYDMLNQRMKSTLRLPNESNNTELGNEINGTIYQDKGLPVYAIVLIALSCIALLLALIYLLYSKNMKNSSSKDGKIKYMGPIREVWANSELDNALNIISRDKKNRLDIKNYNKSPLSYSTDNTYKSDIIEFEK
ncbi:hypothetical protein CONCODRAFT_14878 [Conidiobolus coronatus NRRL 28638]|uniref:Galactose oxidase n=1 Tax=Conidiobolus coronatus (strain ATCC 28846 / CBS 209.66 / NRRL 28638) TaxID=796925 RepID=A0A137PHB0_CONC2|nr:hypothetical protein CONCODRAFT_14878 [Conidiobolus coronatus NRRL 28638]|eukprot:KXN74399.1 hypothetical protein CONCODRAFT_14878 [Conidiobolus coronatus NRRL 28638]